MLIFDIETNGLLDTLTKIHTMTIYDTHTRRFTRYERSDSVRGIERLARADTICGHNIIGFDIPAIQKIHPGWQPTGGVVDTLVWSRLAYPDIKNLDFTLFRKGAIPGKLIGSHKLEAWGYRVGELKGDYKTRPDAFTGWTPALSNYCEQDVRVTAKLVERLAQANCDERALLIEHGVAWILARQERYGFLFDRAKADQLYEHLATRRSELIEELRKTFGSFYMTGKEFVPKRTQRRTTAGGWKELIVEGMAMTKVTLEDFNPSSRHHIANRLKKLYGWEPAEFTETGEPKIDDDTLVGLPWPEAQLLQTYLMIEKRIGQLAEGDKAWLKFVNPVTGRIHGAVNPCGTVTGRMTHFAPNMAQVPKADKDTHYGAECRELFTVPTGKVLVGIDASSLEMCCLAHYLHRYDNGAYIQAVTKGTKEDGTDPHTINTRALGISSRDIGKRWFYAFLYGAGDTKLGKILGVTSRQAKVKRKQFLTNLTSLGDLKKDIEDKLKKRNFLVGLDGRRIPVRSAHSSLNALLQSAGAVIMKQALITLDEMLQAEHGLKPGVDYEFVGNIHDEWQIEVTTEYGDLVGQTGVRAITLAGEILKVNCPLTGEYKIGVNWKETH